MENEIEKWALDFVDFQTGANYPEKFNKEEVGMFFGFSEGYKAALSKGNWTDEDLIKAFNSSKEEYFMKNNQGEGNWQLKYNNAEHYLQSLKS